MKTLELTVWDRIQLDIAIPRNAPLDDIRVLLDILDKLRLSDDEKTAINFQRIKIPTQQGIVEIADFDEDAPTLSDASSVEFENAEFAKLREVANQRRNWPTRIEALELKDKLNSGD